MAPTAFQGSTPPPPQGIVTPEAVILEFQPAGVGSRAVAQIVDNVIRGLLLFVMTVAAYALEGAASALPSWVAVTLFTLLIAFVTVGYGVTFETVWKGKTPGKALLGLRVVTEEGSPIRFRHAAIRGAVAVFEILATSGVIAFVAIFASRRSQRLGDMAAGTLVLRERLAARAPVATTFAPPAGTEDYANTLDVSVLKADEYLAIRSFLVRADGLTSKARQTLSEQLARQFVERLRTTPPDWMPAEVFLVCLAAAYQRRFSGRSQAQS